MMPGMMKDKLAELFKIDVSSWFVNGAVAALDDENYTDIIDVANYLESMDYNLIGDGFVKPTLRNSSSILTIEEVTKLHPEYTYELGDDEKYHFKDEDGNIVSMSYYDNVGQTINNATGNVTSGSEYKDEFGVWRKAEFSESSDGSKRGVVSKIDSSDLQNYRLLRTYLLSNYRIYTLKNADEDLLHTIADAFAKFGGNQDAWAKGLIKLYNAEGGKATGHWWWGQAILGDVVKIDGKTLSLTKGWFNNAMNFSIEGWAPRYGMSLEFLLSLHLGTRAPDLVYAMLQNFDTEIQVYLDDSGKAKVNARYLDPNNDRTASMSPSEGDSIQKVETVLDEHGDWLSSWLVTDNAALEWFANDLALDKEACQTLLIDDQLTLKSPSTCLGEASAYIIEDSTYQTSQFAFWDTSTDPLTGYGLNVSNAKVYNSISSFQPNDFSGTKKGFFGEQHITDYTFDAAHVTQCIGTEERFKDVNFTWLSPVGKYGYDEAEAEGKVEVKSPEVKSFEVSSSFLTAKDKYSCEETVLERHWTSEIDGEDLEYSWLTFKYLICYVGTEIDYWDPFAINGGNAGPFHTNKYVSNDYEWKDTVICEYIVREKTRQELIDCGLMNPDGTPTNPVDQRCSQDHSRKKCCANCQEYVKAAVKAMASVSDQSFSSYTPYIARVIGSWFRDTYFVIPEEADAAINEYGGSIQPLKYDADGDGIEEVSEVAAYSTNHPEVNVANAYGANAKFVQVDEEYLGESGEYWTSYYLKSDGDYQLFVLRSDGTTSNTTMEDFLADGKIDDKYTGEKENAKIKGDIVTGYSSKEEAEKYGWAFVKKAEIEDMSSFKTSHTAGIDASNRIDSSILWSAYGFDNNGSSTNWEKVTRADKNNEVNTLYAIIYGSDSDGDDKSGIFYQLEKTNNVTQVEDAQRGETNALVKYLFKYRKFYTYNGGETRAVEIEHDKQRVLYGYNDYVNKNYDIEGDYYTGKVVADAFDIKDAITADSTITRDNFYHYEGLIDSSGNGRILEDIYGSDWKTDVIDLLSKYGRSALRQSYNWETHAGVGFLDMFGGANGYAPELAEQWLDWQLDMYYMNKYGVDIPSYYNEPTKDLSEFLKLEYDPRDPDLIGTVEITKSSLSVFSILENTGTLDADYAYRDFKELIVELDYFDKEDLSEKNQEVFTWILPDVSPAGWPNRPWDKQNVDYGTLMQSHDTYAALGLFDGLIGSSGDVDESTIFWIGDSWIAGLKGSGVAQCESEYLAGVSSSQASDFTVSDSDVTSNFGGTTQKFDLPENVSAFVICFGMNGVNSSATQSFIEELHNKHQNIPIYMLKISHVGVGYWAGTDSYNSRIDTYNNEMKSWCDGKDYVQFVEDATKTINPGGGVLGTEYDDGSSHFHLSQAGYEAWYNDIVSSIGAGASNGTGSSNRTTLTQTVTTTSSNFDVKELDENASDNTDHISRIVKANGIEYRQFDQSGYYGSVKVEEGPYVIVSNPKSDEKTLAGMGCGVYSITSLMSAYIEDVTPEKTVQWLHENYGDNCFPNTGVRGESMSNLLNDKGIPGAWEELDESKELKLKEALSAGKPVIVNVTSGSNVWTTSGGHFICFCGISPDGKVYTADSVPGGGDRICHEYGGDFESVYASLWADLSSGFHVGLWIPEEAPTGVKQTSSGASIVFEGYEADQNIASPVTGKILEIGKHERLNIYTGEMEEVEFITIQVMDKGTSTNNKESNYFDDIATGSNDDYEYEPSTSFDTVAKALNLFYKEYEDVCDGYTITIDGFDVDLSIEGGSYKENEVHALYNSGQMEIRKEREKAKAEAPFLINCGETEDYPGDEYVADPDVIQGYYIKEGKFIGKTITKDVSATTVPATTEPEPEPPTTTEPPTEPEEETELNMEDKLTYTYADYAKLPDLTGDYMRIQIKDKDYALVDDVERFFDIPEGMGQQQTSTDATILERFTCSFENGALYDYLYGDAKYEGYYVVNYITEDKKYFICMGDHLDDPTNRNFGFGVCHHSKGSYMQVEYYEQVGVDIDSGAYYDEGTKLEVEKVEAVRHMIMEGMRETVSSYFGESLWNSLKPTQQDCILDFAYQYGPGGAPVTWFKSTLSSGGNGNDCPYFSAYGNRGESRKKLWTEGIYIDASGNEIK